MVVCALLAATVAGTVPAVAEGGWHSYIKDWGADAESRRWTDKHKDSSHTTVEFSGCDFHGGGGVDLELNRVKNYLPDVSYGWEPNRCNTSDWGEVKTDGQFYFVKVNSGRLDVKSVTTKY
ncbi:hypothetical protein HUT18_13610 [Streptomyces sp. NA04227]|uniref:hypothetical protein n=1 Tax=Streptomyces sp. NA04227 TaxID=2742136 RepID=UPI00159297DA|nr:hypothetical protein [Streptomyces sp. NA04227]QKW07273.1 hypothetical protein HUT18_13610 [Streptomyces sp. NA04227]